MIDKTVSKNYAAGLFKEALRTGRLDQVMGDMKGLSLLFKEIPDLLKVLTCVTIPFSEKKGILRKVLLNLEKCTLNFLELLLENNRGPFFFSVANEYYRLFLEKQNEAEVRLVSAYPLGPGDAGSLKEILSRKLNKKVLLSLETDRGIMGGLVVYYRDLVIDGSIRTHLEELHGRMKSTRT
jgi:F-type H+-transporting ATPase subunit delta